MNNNYYNCGPSQEQYYSKNQSKKKKYQRQTQVFGNQYSTSRPHNSGISNDFSRQQYYSYNARPDQLNYNYYDSDYSNRYQNVPQSNSWGYHQVQNNYRAAVTFENVSEMVYTNGDESINRGAVTQCPPMYTLTPNGGQKSTRTGEEEKYDVKNLKCSVTKAAEPSKSFQKETKPKRNYKEERAQKQRTNTLLKAFEKPVESSKAERMMERMGWRGGALGVNGAGLVEPIKPHLTQIYRSGLGLEIEKNKKNQKSKTKPTKMNKTAVVVEKKIYRCGKVVSETNLAVDTNEETPEPKPKPVKIRKPRVWKEGQHARELNRLVKRPNLQKFLKSNFLECIKEFVKDDRRSTLEFESSLTKPERYFVHQLVDTFKEKDATLFDMEFMADYSVLEEIWNCNPYVLYTQSEGTPPDRKLVIYKEAPEHVYLITKGDLEAFEPEEEVYDDDEVIIVIDDDATTNAHENSTAANETDEKNLTETRTDTIEITKEATDVAIENIGNTQTDDCGSNLQTVDVNKMEHVKGDDSNGNNKTESLKDKLKREYGNMVSVGRVNVLETTQSELNNVEDGKTIVVNDCHIETRTQHNLDNIELENEEISSSKVINVLNEVKKLLIKYLKEFIEDEKCTQIRFLGEFDEVECEAIESFTEYVRQGVEDLENVSPFIDLEDSSVKDIFQNEVYALSVYLDENEHTVIEKYQREHH